jgi:hypothetical protein
MTESLPSKRGKFLYKFGKVYFRILTCRGSCVVVSFGLKPQLNSQDMFKDFFLVTYHFIIYIYIYIYMYIKQKFW